MLVTLKQILKIAEAEKCAIGSFNTPNLESLLAAIGAAEELKKPIIIMHAQIHEEMGLAKLDVMGPIMVEMADRASVPVCVHLDHGTDLGYLKRALDIGFSSIMYDGSELSYEQNAANTCVAVEMAAAYGASVEAEIGNMGSREGGDEGGSATYTDPELALQFVSETGIDALACSFGTAHGVYFKEPKLDFDRVDKIHSKISVPMVMHGGSGVSHEDYVRLIDLGIRKINYYTYMAKAGGNGVSEMKDMTFFHDIAVAAEAAMKKDIMDAMKVFARID